MPNRRTFLTGVAGASAATIVGGLAPTSATAAVRRRAPVLRTQIGPAWYSRDAVLQWEARRIQVAAHKLRGNAVGALLGDLDALVLRPAADTREITRARNRLVDVKLEMGQQAIRAALASDLALSGIVSPLSAAPKQWAFSQIKIRSDRGTAAGFAHWFRAMVARNRLRDGLIACPDHYRIVTDRHGRQEVIEVTGGAMMAAEFHVNYSDLAHVSVPPDPAFRHSVAGSAVAPSGQVIGSVRHQARSLARGFEGSFNVAFPGTLPGWMVAEHRWHLACEFSNWITAYVHEARL